MTKLFKTALSLTLRFPQIILLIYLINLVFGILAAVIFYKIAADAGNGSLVLDELMIDFDYMVFTDFMRFHGSKFTPVILVALSTSGIYFLLSNFFTGGIFYHYKAQPPAFEAKKFMREGWRMFGKYLLILLLELFVLFLVLMLSGILFFVFALVAEGGSEREYILWLAIPTALLVFMGSIVIVIGDYARYLTFEYEWLGVWGGFGKAVSYIFKYFRTVGFYWIIVVTGLVLGLLYLGVDTLIGMKGMFTVLLMFFIQQIVVAGRVFLKNLNYAVVSEFCQNHPISLPLPVVDTFTDELPDETDESKPLSEE